MSRRPASAIELCCSDHLLHPPKPETLSLDRLFLPFPQDQLFIDGVGCVTGAYAPGLELCSPATSPWSGLAIELGGAGRCDPAGPISNPGCVGAVNQTGVPGDIALFGNRLARENNALLVASNTPPGQFGIFAMGLGEIPPAVVFSGNGFICINPVVMGGLGRFLGPNQIQAIDAGEEARLDTLAGQWSLSAIPTATGAYAALFGTTSHFQFWHRESVGAGSNFTGSCQMTWL